MAGRWRSESRRKWSVSMLTYLLTSCQFHRDSLRSLLLLLLLHAFVVLVKADRRIFCRRRRLAGGRRGSSDLSSRAAELICLSQAISFVWSLARPRPFVQKCRFFALFFLQRSRRHSMDRSPAPAMSSRCRAARRTRSRSGRGEAME